MTALADAIFDAVQALVAGRCYRHTLPEGYTLPALTFHRVSTTFEYAHDGDQGITHSRWQISCWATTHAAAEALAATVKTTLDAWTDAQLQALQADNAYGLSDPDTGVAHVALDVIIWWKS